MSSIVLEKLYTLFLDNADGEPNGVGEEKHIGKKLKNIRLEWIGW
ncbi:hypothetical protein [Thermococcus sp.]|nr:hypothetical protein [Thermococcus sp.]